MVRTLVITAPQYDTAPSHIHSACRCGPSCDQRLDAVEDEMCGYDCLISCTCMPIIIIIILLWILNFVEHLMGLN